MPDSDSSKKDSDFSKKQRHDGGMFKSSNFYKSMFHRQPTDGSTGPSRRGLQIAEEKAAASLLDFVIRSETGIDDSRFSSSILYNKVYHEKYGKWMISRFSVHAKRHTGCMVTLAVLSIILSPMRLSQISCSYCTALGFDYSNKHFWVLFTFFYNTAYLLGLLYQIRISIIIKEWECFDPILSFRHVFLSHTTWKDIFAIILCYLSLAIYGQEQSSSLKYLCFFECLKFKKQLIHKGGNPILDLLKWFFFAVILVHILACFWYTIVVDNNTIDLHMSITLRARRFENEQYFSYSAVDITGKRQQVWMWVASFREALLILLSESRPCFSNYELIYAFLVSLFGALLLAIVFAEAYKLKQNRSLLADFQQHQLIFSEQAMKTMRVPPELADRIIDYQRFSFQCCNHHYSEVLFANISEPLALELKLTLYHDLLKTAPFLSQASANVFKKVVMTLKERLYQPGDLIVRKNEPAQEMFFIHRGVVEILFDLNGETYAQFNAGNYFGELAFLRYAKCAQEFTRRTAWVRSKGYTMLCCLGTERFHENFELFPEEKELLIQNLIKILPDMQSSDDSSVANRQTYFRDKEGKYVNRPSNDDALIADVDQTNVLDFSPQNDKKLSHRILRTTTRAVLDARATVAPPPAVDSNRSSLDDAADVDHPYTSRHTIPTLLITQARSSRTTQQLTPGSSHGHSSGLSFSDGHRGDDDPSSHIKSYVPTVLKKTVQLLRGNFPALGAITAADQGSRFSHVAPCRGSRCVSAQASVGSGSTSIHTTNVKSVDLKSRETVSLRNHAFTGIERLSAQGGTSCLAASKQRALVPERTMRRSCSFPAAALMSKSECAGDGVTPNSPTINGKKCSLVLSSVAGDIITSSRELSSEGGRVLTGNEGAIPGLGEMAVELDKAMVRTQSTQNITSKKVGFASKRGSHMFSRSSSGPFFDVSKEEDGEVGSQDLGSIMSSSCSNMSLSAYLKSISTKVTTMGNENPSMTPTSTGGGALERITGRSSGSREESGHPGETPGTGQGTETKAPSIDLVQFRLVMREFVDAQKTSRDALAELQEAMQELNRRLSH